MSVLLFICFFFVVSVVAQQYAATDPCNVTPDRLASAMRASYMQRALCEGYNFKHAVCSNYWMANDEVRSLSGKFMRCQENINAAFRLWVYGTDAAEIPGAFAYEGILDRLFVTDNKTSLVGNATETYQQTMDLVHQKYQSNLDFLRDLQANKTFSAQQEVLFTQEFTRTLSAQEGQTTRTQVQELHDTLRALIRSEESQTRQFIVENNVQTRTLASNEHEAARTTDTAESSSTRQHDTAQAVATISYNLNEETTTRQREDDQSTQTRTHHTEVLATTRSLVITEIDKEQESVRSLAASEGQTARSLIDASAQQTQTAFAQEEAATVTFSKTKISANRLANQEASQTAQANLVQEYNSQTAVTRDSIVDATYQIAQTVNSTESDTQTFITNKQDSIRATVSTQENATRSFFSNTALPAMMASTAGAQATLDSESSAMISVLLHFNLASNYWHFFCKFGYVDLFSRNGPYLLQSQTIVNDTVNYYQNNYGANRIGNARYYLNSGNAKLASGDYRGALGQWRQAYRDATAHYLH